MNILAIDTSCDETAAAITHNVQLHSNKVWSSSSLHSKFGGVMPSVAKRAHEERIEWVVDKALGTKHKNLNGIDAIAVTIGPGLAIALGVGIDYAKKLAIKHKLPLIPVNHIEGHLLSSLARSKRKQNTGDKIQFPNFGLVLSGGTTLLCLIHDIGKYEVLAETVDDALGEALDKAARLLGFGYPGGEVLEKFAKKGNPKRFTLPIPLINDQVRNRFSYSGIKTAFVRLYESIDNPTKQDIYDLAATFQDTAFTHIERVLDYQLFHRLLNSDVCSLLLGGGVASNIEIRKRIKKICKKHKISLKVPYNKKLNGDNAAMIGVTAYLKNKNLTKGELIKKYSNYESVDRNPRLSL